jgi:PAS domain
VHDGCRSTAPSEPMWRIGLGPGRCPPADRGRLSCIDPCPANTIGRPRARIQPAALLSLIPRSIRSMDKNTPMHYRTLRKQRNRRLSVCSGNHDFRRGSRRGDVACHPGRLRRGWPNISTGQPVEHLETSRVRKDGTVFPVSITLSPVRDADGVVVGASVICRDTTEQA